MGQVTYFWAFILHAGLDTNKFREDQYYLILVLSYLVWYCCCCFFIVASLAEKQKRFQEVESIKEDASANYVSCMQCFIFSVYLQYCIHFILFHLSRITIIILQYIYNIGVRNHRIKGIPNKSIRSANLH